jgi:EAL domain-containing protein (putative c-di-GMP-specific phosphodiesterase class I)
VPDVSKEPPSTGIVRLARLLGIRTVAEYVSDPAIARAAISAR